jgi:xylono-1,5-lactonase
MTELIQVATGFRTVEGPTLGLHGELFVGDVRGGGVHRVTPDGQIEVIVPKRKGVGGICPHADGGIVVSGRDLTHVNNGQSRVIFTRDDVVSPPPAQGQSLSVGGFNDIGADPAGRIFAGVQRFTPDGEYGPGLLVMVTAEHTGVVVFDGLLPNGNCVSPDQRWLYQVDSTGQRVLVFDLSAEPPLMVREFSTAALPGHPDGAAADVEGQIWIAFHHGGCVGRFDPAGHLTRRIDMPTPTVTSVCFGALGSQELFIVTDDESDGPDPRGSIYRVDVGIDGSPVYGAAV